MHRFLLVLVLLLAACGSPGIPTPTVANDEQMIRDSLLAYVRDQGQTGLFQVTAIQQEGVYAFAIADPAEGQQLDPLHAYLKREGGAWSVLTAGTAFGADQLTELGVPKALWQTDVIATEPTQPAPTQAPAPPTDAPTGAISGNVGYPSEVIPALDVYAINADNPELFYHLPLAANTTEYALAGLAVGDYYVVAYLAASPENPSPDFAGAYTPAVECGLAATCTDHTPLKVTVTAGQTMENIDLTDWYAPPETLPQRPQGQPQSTRTP